jgi:hypothetical protein
MNLSTVDLIIRNATMVSPESMIDASGKIAPWNGRFVQGYPQAAR